MPPVAVETNLVEYKLPWCSEHCRLYMYGEIFYHRRDIHDMKDFNITCEYINNDETYQLIVSNRVRKMLIENKVRVYHYTPIVIIDD